MFTPQNEVVDPFQQCDLVVASLVPWKVASLDLTRISDAYGGESVDLGLIASCELSVSFCCGLIAAI